MSTFDRMTAAQLDDAIARVRREFWGTVSVAGIALYLALASLFLLPGPWAFAQSAGLCGLLVAFAGALWFARRASVVMVALEDERAGRP